MRLVACAPPEGPLEAAPITELAAALNMPSCEGFWAPDDQYYARSVTADGVAAWFRLEEMAGEVSALVPHRAVARPVPGRRARPLTMLDRSSGDRRILVWASHRGTR